MNPSLPVSVACLLVGIATQAASPIEAYASFAGLQYGNTGDNIRELFGPADVTGGNAHSKSWSYISPDIAFFLDGPTKRITEIFVHQDEVKDLKAYLAKHGVTDAKLDLIGKDTSLLTRAFGPPSDKGQAYMIFRKEQIVAQFYIEGSLITGIHVLWHYPPPAGGEAATKGQNLRPEAETKEVSGFHGFAAQESDAQEYRTWCWAACIAMVLSRNGYPVEQRTIVEARKNGGTSGAKMDEIQSIVNSAGRNLNITARVTPPLSKYEVVEMIDRGDPIIANTSFVGRGHGGHAIVIYGYQIDREHNVLLQRFDPWVNRGVLPLVRFEDFDWINTVVVNVPPKPEVTTIDPMAEKHLSYAEARGSAVDWATEEEAGTVAYSFSFKNSHPSNPINVTFRIRSGTVQKNSSKKPLSDRDWVPHAARDETVTIAPQATKVISGKVLWYGASVNRSKFVSPTVTACHFVDIGSRTAVVATSALFDSVGPLKAGDTAKTLLQKLGPPESDLIKGDLREMTFFLGGLKIVCDVKTDLVEFVTIKKAYAGRQLAARSAGDAKLALFGVGESKIRAVMGTPDGDRNGSLRYRHQGVQGKDVEVSFGMDDREDRCKEIGLFWTVGRKLGD